MLLSVNTVNAQLIYQKDSPANIIVPCINNGTRCSGSATCNITAIYPNSSVFIDNLAMSNSGDGIFSYQLLDTETSILGEYQATVFCNDGSDNGYSTFQFYITGNGKAEPTGSIVVFFSAIFILLSIFLVFMLFYGIGHMKDFTYDLRILSLNLGGYFGLFAVFMLEKYYLGNIDMENLMTTFISVGAITNVFIPVIGFLISYFKNSARIGDFNM
jgi:hypothetical protein